MAYSSHLGMITDHLSHMKRRTNCFNINIFSFLFFFFLPTMEVYHYTKKWFKLANYKGKKSTGSNRR